MMNKNEILNQALAQLKLYSKDIAALRKVKKNGGTPPAKFNVDLPHFTYILPKKMMGKKVEVKDKGIRVIILDGATPAGTLDFVSRGKKMVFSHFTFGKNARSLYKTINRIYKKYKIPESILLEILKSPILGKAILRFPSDEKMKYLDLKTDTNPRTELDERTFIKGYNADWKNLLKEEKRFKAERKKVKLEKVKHLKYLHYL